MEKLNVFSCFLVLFLCTRFCQGAPNKGTWCVANWFVKDDDLKAYLEETCDGRICRNILPGYPCFEPNNYHSHASYILNKQFKKNHAPCREDLGMIIHMNPSYGDCKYK
ncbi:glucan endo-1,3-beta-glucosidase [Capsicum annuum]|uniref:glucan endo-1,3-beta-glucosidase n=1 Tax=Capsicum annuum TaxID=4072 RepID=UPI001FB083C9|nr:glucan endo-1,3-beta-glucosidase [Capsicum annuum]